MKLTTLLALSNASRSSDLVALDTRYIQKTPEGVTFRIPGLTKTRRSGPPRSMKVLRFEEQSICPVVTLECYLSRTRSIREEARRSPLLLSFQKPHKAVTSATIARWVKEILSLAGVDTGSFGAHSTRAASVSAARVRGVTLKDIMETAGWRRTSTFETFYHKPLTSDFSEAVLGGKKGITNTFIFKQYTVIYAALSRCRIRDFTRIFRSDVKSEFY